MWAAKAEQLASGNWAIAFIEQINDWQCIRFGWKEIGSRLPMGEKEFKRRAKNMGGRLEKVVGERKMGLAGICYTELSAMTFDTQAQAETVIAELVTPSFMAVNLCR